MENPMAILKALLVTPTPILEGRNAKEEKLVQELEKAFDSINEETTFAEIMTIADEAIL